MLTAEEPRTQSRRRRPTRWLRIAVAALLLLASPARGWFTIGHSMCARAGLESLPEGVPAFLGEGAELAAHTAVDPDVMKARETPQLLAMERPEHYIDLERLGGQALPADRYAYLGLLRKLRLDPSRTGQLPYAVTEWAQRLTLALAEHRRWPEDLNVQAKALVYAGHLAHYAGDLTQPLHTSVHHNGRAEPPSWKSPGTGIHFQVDALFEQATFDRQEAVRGMRAEVLEDLFAGVLVELTRSHALVERVYALERELPAVGATGPTPPAVAAFAAERFRACASFYGTLVRTAWEQSERVELPSWLPPSRQPVMAPAAVEVHEGLPAGAGEP
jgi:hypothetical protein